MYAFSGAVAELNRTIPLVAGEQILLQGVMRLRGRRLPRPAVLRLTDRRLVVLAHFALRPDTVWELPKAAVTNVELRAGRIRIHWADGDSVRHSLQLAKWTGPARKDRPVDDVAAAAELLQRWLTV